MSESIYISTYLGNRFYPQDPARSQIDIEDIAHGLAYTCRFNGQTRTFYSVAQHSLIVSDLVTEELKLDALLHDASEAYLGDVVKPLKALLTEYKIIEKQTSDVIAQTFGLIGCCHPAIKQADLIALATEKRDLMPYSVEPWHYLAHIEPLPQRLIPQSPNDAKKAFMQRFAELAKPLTFQHPI